MDELMKALECCAEFACGECPYQKYNSTDYILKCSHKLIADLATANLKPVKHGQWIVGLDGSCMCSNCNKVSRYEIGFYCSHCGAKMMDLEEEV